MAPCRCSIHAACYWAMNQMYERIRPTCHTPILLVPRKAVRAGRGGVVRGWDVVEHDRLRGQWYPPDILSNIWPQVSLRYRVPGADKMSRFLSGVSISGAVSLVRQNVPEWDCCPGLSKL
jgi:hypothetical protein